MGRGVGVLVGVGAGVAVGADVGVGFTPVHKGATKFGSRYLFTLLV